MSGWEWSESVAWVRFEWLGRTGTADQLDAGNSDQLDAGNSDKHGVSITVHVLNMAFWWRQSVSDRCFQPSSLDPWLYDTSRAGEKFETMSRNTGYTKYMSLKIRNVGPADFGSYRCVAKNSLGETDGLIKLDGRKANKKHDPMMVGDYGVEEWKENGPSIRHPPGAFHNGAATPGQCVRTATISCCVFVLLQLLSTTLATHHHYHHRHQPR
uniref:Immunoglobulin I-set domain-containing protein n=1 Tax=Anopheles farauti TaxID=69004 RepID=A0A182QTY9_9DIPT